MSLQRFVYKPVQRVIAPLCVISKHCKQFKCLSTGEWVKKLRYIHIVECYLASKRNELPGDTHNLNESQNNHAMWKHLCKILGNAKQPVVTESRSDLSWGQWGWWGGSSRVPHVEAEGETDYKGTGRNFVIDNIFIFLIMVVILWVISYIKIYQVYTLHTYSLLCINYFSIKLFTKRKKKIQEKKFKQYFVNHCAYNWMS